MIITFIGVVIINLLLRSSTELDGGGHDEYIYSSTLYIRLSIEAVGRIVFVPYDLVPTIESTSEPRAYCFHPLSFAPMIVHCDGTYILSLHNICSLNFSSAF